MNTGFSFKNHKISILLAFLSSLVVVLQTSRFWVLFDLSYILEHSFRMSLGEVIYKDFFVPYPPGTLLIQEYLIKAFGASLYPQIIYCSLISFLTFLFVYRILFFLNDDKTLNLFLALPVTVTGGYGIFSQPFYDPDSVFFILFSLFLILLCYERKFPKFYTFIAGMMAVVPSFFKQNTGLMYFALIHFAFIATVIFRKGEIRFRQYFVFALGSVLSILAMSVYFSATSGLNNYIMSTITIPSQTRLPEPMRFLKIYMNFVVLRYAAIWLAAGVGLSFLNLKNKWVNIIFIVLVLIPFYIIPVFRALFFGNFYYDQFYIVWPAAVIVCSAAVVYGLIRSKDIQLFFIFLTVAIIGVVNAAFLSQGYSGSTYGFWPILCLLFAFLYFILANLGLKKHLALLKKLFIFNSSAVTVSMIIFVWFNYQQTVFSRFDNNGPVQSSKENTLKGLSLPGEYIPNLDNLLAFTRNEIPPEEPVIFIPHEDPFYFASGRKPYFPVYFFDWTLKINSIEGIIKMVKSYSVRWMIVKTHLQAKGTDNYINLNLLISELKKEFVLYKTLPGYEIYRSE